MSGTHERYIHAIRAAAAVLLPRQEAERVNACKLTYGAGRSGLRGCCYFEAWQNGHPDAVAFVEICARGESTPIQVCGTTLHELGHVLAGPSAGHGPAWKACCKSLGLRHRNLGMTYRWADIAMPVRMAAALLVPTLSDGAPSFKRSAPIAVTGAGGCSAGVGVRGGTSRGAGSGSRLRLWVCGCAPIIRVRVASDDFRALCTRCGQAFIPGPVRKSAAS